MRSLRALLAIACAAAAVALAPHAMAQEADDIDLEPIADSDLGALRGGFFTVNGITFDFGAVVRTTIDGAPTLETRLNWTPDGVRIDDTSTLFPIQLSGVGGWGVDASDATGSTLVGHRLIDGALQGFIINSADNRTINQDIQVTLTLPGFDTVQREMMSGRLGMAIDMDMSNGLVAARGQ